MARTRGCGLGWLLLASAVLCGLCATAASAGERAGRIAGRLVLRERVGLSAAAFDRALRAAGARRTSGLVSLDSSVVEFADADLPDVEAALRRSGLFRSIERDYLVHVADDGQDPYYGAQWGLPRVGAPAAWNLSTGAGVTVAVVDTGVDLTHPDLQGHLLPGYDFANDDDDPSDDNGHGTRMSGIVAATRGNGIGVVGVAPDAEILPVKVLDDQGYGPYSAVAAGITYAVDHGAKVINLSLVGAAQSSILQAAVDYVTQHNAVLVAAAGNDGSDLPAYPAAANGAVAVSAIDDSDLHPAFSNYGSWISFAAPGVDVVTTTLGGDYASSSGTSPAAAVGSGVFALLFAAQPALPRADAIARVQAGAIDLGSAGWDPYFGWGRADAYAALIPGQHGAPQQDRFDPTVSIVSPAKDSLVSGTVPVDVTADDDIGIARVELFVDNRWYAAATSQPYAFVVDTTDYAPGPHKLRAYAYDINGNVTKTKIRKISFTPGAGLLVKRATAKPSSTSITATFALPAGVEFDPGRDRVTIMLTSAHGTVLAASVEADALASAGDRMRATVAPNVPAVGSVRVSAARSGAAPTYAIKIKASNLSGMTALDPLMSLAIQVGTAQLSQSLSFRARGATLLYP